MDGAYTRTLTQHNGYDQYEKEEDGKCLLVDEWGNWMVAVSCGQNSGYLYAPGYGATNPCEVDIDSWYKWEPWNNWEPATNVSITCAPPAPPTLPPQPVAPPAPPTSPQAYKSECGGESAQDLYIGGYNESCTETCASQGLECTFPSQETLTKSCVIAAYAYFGHSCTYAQPGGWEGNPVMNTNNSWCYYDNIWDPYNTWQGVMDFANITCPVTGHGDWEGDWVRLCPCLPSPAPSGSTLELTGDAPKILFGSIDEPVCELSLDRSNGRLESTCAVSGTKRRLGEDVATVSVAEHAALKAEHAALKAEHVALEKEIGERVGELRRALEALEPPELIFFS